MRRSILAHHLGTLEPTEYSHLQNWHPDLAFALLSAAMAAIPGTHPDQSGACREWLDTVMPTDRSPGWLTRLAGLLLAARERDSPLNAFRPELEDVWLLQAAYMLATDITTGAPRPHGSAITIMRRLSMTTRSTPRAALGDILDRIRGRHPGYTPSVGIRAAVTPGRRRAAHTGHTTPPTPSHGAPVLPTDGGADRRDPKGSGPAMGVLTPPALAQIARHPGEPYPANRRA
jgi:hypothetical protein